MSAFDPIGWASGISAVAAALVSLFQLRSQHERARASIDALDSNPEKDVLASSDLKTVGSYLFDTLGNVQLSDFVRDADLRRRTNVALERLTSFIGTEGEEHLVEEAQPSEEAITGQPEDSELAKAVHSIDQGEVWNGLAQCRRDLEIRLANAVFGDQKPERLSVSGVVSAARRAGILSEDDEQRLRFALNVCNRGIHGEDISSNLALEAVRNVEYALREIPQAGQNSPASR